MGYSCYQWWVWLAPGFFHYLFCYSVRLRALMVHFNISYMNRIMGMLAHGPWLGPRPGQAKPGLSTLAWPMIFTGQSQGLQAKLGQDITTSHFFIIPLFLILSTIYWTTQWLYIRLTTIKNLSCLFALWHWGKSFLSYQMYLLLIRTT